MNSNLKQLEILQPLDAEHMQGVIREDYPEIEIVSTKVIGNGWDNVALIVNDEYIFRFPIDNEKDCAFEVELKLLQMLKDKITLQIPNPQYVGKKYRYFGYKMIPGQSLTKEVLAALSQEERKKLVSDLAQFLFEMHSAMSIEFAAELGILEEIPASYANLIMREIPAKLTQTKIVNFAKKTVDRFLNMQAGEFEKVLLHNDLHEDNMAFDTKAKCLNGIFDFGDVMIWDVNLDFSRFYRLGEDFKLEVISEYERISSRKLDVQRVDVYSMINELSDVAELIDQPDNPAFQSALDKVQQWARELG